MTEIKAVIGKYAEKYARFERDGGSVFQETWPRRHYQVIVCTFVLGVLPTKRARLDLLKKVAARLSAGGIVFLSVRGFGDVKTKARQGRKWRDGYITPVGTFIKPFRRTELTGFARGAGLVPHPNVGKWRSNSGIIDLVLVRQP